MTKKRLAIAIVLQLAACGAGAAYADTCGIQVIPDKVGSDGVPHYRIVMTRAQVQFVRNANECAPWESAAVWAPGNPTAEPIGYCCYHNPNR
jgi:hypothetical protein